MDAPLMTVDGLSTRYRVEKRTLAVTEDIRFDVRPQETVCLIGESGCGKTVTLLSLIGLSGGEVTGSVRLDGQELTRLSLREWRKIRGREISFIFQDPNGALNPVITVGQSVLRAASGASAPGFGRCPRQDNRTFRPGGPARA
jgi:ABC-type glutathione transport system ATPase component